ncbi:MAG: FkbM family methyltransferase [Clostridia bacterium]|jgi:FkbM family methyltransferase|nr:FkbM family methyltransferase [Clostridia bacterium]
MLVVPRWGGRLIVPSDDLSLAPELILNGLFEFPLTTFLVNGVRPGSTVIDVGANLGYFTVLLGLLVGPSGRVLAYEPNPELHSFLMDNLSLNYLHDRITVYRKAAYSSSARIPLYMTRRFMGNTSIHRHDAEYAKHYVDEIQEIEVEAAPLDIHLGQVGHIDLLKMDIEGGEYRAFLGMREMIERNAVTTVVFELNKTMLQDDWRPLCDLLLELNRSYQRVFFTLSSQGNLVQADLDQLLAEGSNPFVVMQSRH